MHWNRSALIFLLCSGFCTLNFGCAAFNAIVSSPAGHSAPRGEAKKLAAIGRVFENQGHYRQAQVMYRKALKAQPGNVVAQERLQYIASRQADREFQASEKDTLAAVAMADSLTTKAHIAGAEKTDAGLPLAGSPVVQVSNISETLEQERNAVMASLNPAGEVHVRNEPAEKSGGLKPKPQRRATKATASASTAAVSRRTSKVTPAVEVSKEVVTSTAVPQRRSVISSNRVPFVPVAIEPMLGSPDEAAERLVLHQTTEPQVADVESFESIDLQYHRGTVTRAGAADVALTFLETTDDAGVANVSYSDDTEGVANVLQESSNGAGGWKSTGRTIPLEELLQWTDTPIANRDHLLFALTNGEDDGVKALAAAMLAECPMNDHEVDAALDHACQNASDVLKLSARDVLIQRGRITEQGIADLLDLMRNGGSEIRAQAAASLRNCAGSRFGSQCVSGLGRMLTDNDPEIVAIAATTLGDFGREAVPHRDRLIYLLATTDNELILDAVNTAVNRVPPQ